MSLSHTKIFPNFNNRVFPTPETVDPIADTQL